MQIRSATATDLGPATSLLCAQFAEHRIALEHEELREAVRLLIDEPSRGAVLLAEDPGPVGLAVLAYTWTLEHGGLVAWLDELFVVPTHRGRGIGRALLGQAEREASRRGCRAMELEVDVDHARAESLYRREGFAVLPRRRFSKPLR
jgi:GNAT superfamily N-acetyltransferase